MFFISELLTKAVKIYSLLFPSESFGDTILDGLEKLTAKMSETGADRQAAILADLHLR